MSILQPIKPQYCELIASGKKTIEVRKTRPKLETPFKVYIYMTKSHLVGNRKAYKDRMAGKVIGEYVCDKIEPKYCANAIATYYENEQGTCLSNEELRMYADGVKPLYFWHISNLKIYAKPKELSEFYNNCCDYFQNGACYCPEFCRWQEALQKGAMPCVKPLTHPPQSWCYVEEV